MSNGGKPFKVERKLSNRWKLLKSKENRESMNDERMWRVTDVSWDKSKMKYVWANKAKQKRLRKGDGPPSNVGTPRKAGSSSHQRIAIE